MLEESDFSITPSSENESDYDETFQERRRNPDAKCEVVYEMRQAPVKKFGSFRVTNKRVKKVSLKTPLQYNHTYNAVSFNVRVKRTAQKWVFVTGFEAQGLLQVMSIYKLVGKDVNQYTDQKDQWELIHQKWYQESWHKPRLLTLDEPVRIGPGETCGFYIHSNCENDEGLMYRSCIPGVVLEDSCIQVLHGWAHTSFIPFDLTRGWIREHRVLSGCIFYEPTPLRWSPDRNFLWSHKTTFQLALDAVMSSCFFSPGILVELMIFCGMDWFDPDMDSLLEASDDGYSSVSSVQMVGSNRKQGRVVRENHQASPYLSTLMNRAEGVYAGVFSLLSNPSSLSAPVSTEPTTHPVQMEEEKSPPPMEQGEDQSDDDESVVLITSNNTQNKQNKFLF